MSVAGVAHLVERHLAKVEVASSSLVARSIEQIRKYLLFFCAFSQARRMESDSPVDCQSPPFPAGTPYDLLCKSAASLVARSIEQIRKYLLFFALISKEPLSLRTDEYRADRCGSFRRFPPVVIRSPRPSPMGRVAPASSASVRRMRAVPLSMEEMLLKRYHLNTLILKIFSDC